MYKGILHVVIVLLASNRNVNAERRGRRDDPLQMTKGHLRFKSIRPPSCTVPKQGSRLEDRTGTCEQPDSCAEQGKQAVDSSSCSEQGRTCCVDFDTCTIPCEGNDRANGVCRPESECASEYTSMSTKAGAKGCDSIVAAHIKCCARCPEEEPPVDEEDGAGDGDEAGGLEEHSADGDGGDENEFGGGAVEEEAPIAPTTTVTTCTVPKQGRDLDDRQGSCASSETCTEEGWQSVASETCTEAGTICCVPFDTCTLPWEINDEPAPGVCRPESECAYKAISSREGANGCNTIRDNSVKCCGPRLPLPQPPCEERTSKETCCSPQCFWYEPVGSTTTSSGSCKTIHNRDDALEGESLCDRNDCVPKVASPEDTATHTMCSKCQTDWSTQGMGVMCRGTPPAEGDMPTSTAAEEKGDDWCNTHCHQRPKPWPPTKCPESDRVTNVCQEVHGYKKCPLRKNYGPRRKNKVTHTTGDERRRTCARARTGEEMEPILEALAGNPKAIEAANKNNADCWTRINNIPEVGNWVCKPSPHVRGESETPAYFQNGDNTEVMPAITRDEIIERGAVWLSKRVQYNQGMSHCDPDVKNAEGTRHQCYRTDCNGYVAMAWRSHKQFGTCTWMYNSVLNDADETTLITQIDCDDLLPGDAVISTPHIMLFRKWVDQSQKKWMSWEEKGTRYGTVQEIYQFITIEAAQTENSRITVKTGKRGRNETPSHFGVFLKDANGRYKDSGNAKRAHICIRRSGITEPSSSRNTN